MGKDQQAATNQLREQQEGALEAPTRDVSRHSKEGSARIFVGTALFYIALPAFLLAVVTFLYSGLYWLRTAEWKHVTLVDLTTAFSGWQPSSMMFDYVLSQAPVALPAMVLALVLFVVCALLLAD